MKTDYLRLVNFTKDGEAITGIFHKWIQKQDDKILALVESLKDGKVVFLKPEEISFLGYHETRNYWQEVENRPLF